MTSMWVTVLSAVTLTLVFGTFLRITIGNRRIGKLEDQDPGDQDVEALECWPSISVVVAARNEQANIQPAMESLLQFDYEDFEVIVVNDRSTDRTGAILAALAAEHTKLAVLNVDELPPKWLGKNHALWFGAQHARGAYLLFTDADVVMDRRTLRHAMAYAVREQVDHLAVSPDPVMPTVMLQAFVVLFVDLFAIFTRLWKVADPKSSAHVGIGAFNLVRAEVYQAVGTHETIAMRPDDDLKLGKIIKMQGYRQRILIGGNMVRVPWYGSVRELVSGMEKNAFSGVDYQISKVVAATVVLLLLAFWPFIAIWVTSGLAWLLYAGTVLVLLGRAAMVARELRQSPLCVPLVPLAVVLLIYIQWRAMLLTYINGGIRWRDTHYSLAELKANKV